MFFFKVSVLLEELQKLVSEVYDYSKVAWEVNLDGVINLDLSLDILSISIYYAVMERSKKIKVVTSKFIWSYLGSFYSVYDYFVKTGYPKNLNGNMVIGTNNYTAFIGLKNCNFVAIQNANLILQKDNSQDVKSIYNSLEENNSHLLY